MVGQNMLTNTNEQTAEENQKDIQRTTSVNPQLKIVPYTLIVYSYFSNKKNYSSNVFRKLSIFAIHFKDFHFQQS